MAARKRPPRARYKLKPTSLVYWARLLLAIAAALLVFLLRLKGTMQVVGVAVVIYVISVLLVKYGFKFGEGELKGKYRFATLGVGTFIMIWLTVLILLFTLAKY